MSDTQAYINLQTGNANHTEWELLVLIHARVNAFYGIKYAKSPAGELRWRAPVPIDLDNNGPPLNLTATRPASRCPNGRMPAEFDSLPQSASALDEDCLALDVIVPSVPASSKLPVLVQIHGGGWSSTKSEIVKLTRYQVTP